MVQYPGSNVKINYFQKTAWKKQHSTYTDTNEILTIFLHLNLFVIMKTYIIC